MPRPGVDVALLNTPGSVSVDSDTGTAFVTGITERGPVVPVLLTSLNDYALKYGARVSYGILYDWLDVYFREGGSRVYVSRVVGPAATTGTLNLLDAGAGVSLVVSANGPGAWSNSYKVQVVAGGGAGTYQIKVLDVSNNVLENSPDLTIQQDAVNWSQSSNYIRIALGATALVPAVAAATLISAGNDDRNNIVDANWQTSQDRFTADLGPGQIVQPGRTTSVAYGQVTTHANARNRIAILDAPDTNSSSTLTTSRTSAGFQRMAGYFAGWFTVPGVTSGTFRSIPPSAMVCGFIGRNDPSFGTNRPAAGSNTISRYAVGMTQLPFDDTTRATLNTAGVNLIRQFQTGIMIYGWRSAADPVNDSNWLDLANSRLYMDLAAEFQTISEGYAFAEIDGQNGVTIAGLHDALAGACLLHYDAGELFGNSPDQAFIVNTGNAVNTLATLQNLELHAIVQVKMSPFAEWVQIQVVKRQLTEAVG